MNRRIHVAEGPFVGGQLPVRMHVPFAGQADELALYAREKAFMKDMPAALLVALSVRDTELMHRVFDRVADNGRVLRTVFQMIRSGQFKNKAGKGRVGLSSSVQRAFQRWLNNASIGKLLSASIGNDPSLRGYPAYGSTDADG